MQNTAPRQGIAGAAEYLAAQGRNGDTMLSHTTAGETIIPQEILDSDFFSFFPVYKARRDTPLTAIT